MARGRRRRARRPEDALRPRQREPRATFELSGIESAELVSGGGLGGIAPPSGGKGKGKSGFGFAQGGTGGGQGGGLGGGTGFVPPVGGGGGISPIAIGSLPGPISGPIPGTQKPPKLPGGGKFPGGKPPTK